MLIDWFTVAAQALNFLVLVWLLKRFLYRPVLDAIDAREARIAQQVADAQAAVEQAGSEREALRQRSDELEHQRAALLDEARAAAAAERRRLADAASREAAAVAARRRAALAAESAQLRQELVERVRREVFAIARQAFAELSDADIEQRMAEVFAQRLRGLEAATRSELAAALQQPGAVATVRSTLALPQAQQESVRRAVEATFGTGVALQFEVAPHDLGGIELVACGRRLGWSIDGYLAALEADVAGVLAPGSEEVRVGPPPPGAGADGGAAP